MQGTLIDIFSAWNSNSSTQTTSIKQNYHLMQDIIGSHGHNVIKGYPQKVYITYMKLIASKIGLKFIKKS